jgi:hypothetical protein
MFNRVKSLHHLSIRVPGQCVMIQAGSWKLPSFHLDSQMDAKP